MRLFYILSIVTFYLLECTFGANILFLHHFATHSHIVSSWNIAKALRNRGHEVSYIASAPPPENTTDIPYLIPKELDAKLEELVSSGFGIKLRLKYPAFLGGNAAPLTLLNVFSTPPLCDAMLSSPDFQEWLKTSGPKVDLIIVESMPECALGIAEITQSKVIVYQINSFFFEILDSLGAQEEMISNVAIPYKNPLTTFQRVKTILGSFVSKIGRQVGWYLLDKSFQKHLKDFKSIPPMEQLAQNNINLVLYNGHLIEETSRSLPPNFQSIFGVHISETTSPLDKKIEDFLQNRPFIYISLGTVVDLNDLPDFLREMFFEAINTFPDIKFLWKWNAPVPKNIPKNVYTAPWFIQQDILSHPNIVGFVMQGGRPSAQEAIYNAVPLVTIPILGDQDFNSLLLEDLGVSINLEISTLSTAQLIHAFEALISGKLKPRMTEISSIIKDVPMKPLEKAVWWVEYVLRHSDLSHLKPRTANQSWITRNLIDVYFFILLILFAFIYLVYFFIRKNFVIIWSFMSSSGHKNPSKLKAS